MIDDTTDRCVLRHDKPRRAQTGSLICTKHDHALRDDLRDIEILYALLDHVTEPGSVVMDELVRYAKRPDPAAPMRLEVAVLRDQRTTWDVNQPDAVSVLAVITSWATIVRDDMRLTPPAQATLTSELGTLRAQHDYVTAQAWVDEYAREIHRAAQALRHVCGEHDGQPVGRCQVIHDDDTECGGPLFPDRYGLMRVRCARCGETWDQDDLRRLGLLLES